MISFILLILPLVSAVVLLLSLRARPSFRQTIAVISLLLQFIFSVFFAYNCYQGFMYVSSAGGWPAPYGITLVIDLFSALLLSAVSFIFLVTVTYGFFEGPMHVWRLPLIFFLQAGCNLSLMTGDLFNLFVAFEVMLSSSYALMTLEAKEADLKPAFSYVTVNLLSSLIFLCCAAIIYGYTHHLNMAALAIFFKDSSQNPLVVGIMLLLLAIFGLKAGMFPLYFWLPNSYPILPTSLLALFGGVLTKIGIYLIIRLFVTVLPFPNPLIQWILIVIACITMVAGVVGAISKYTIKEILSYHIISQIGYMLLAISFFTPFSIAAALLFIIHNLMVKSSLFLYGGIASIIYRTDEIEKMGNVWKLVPWVGVLFLFQAFSLAGLPPFSGFWGKYLIILESLKLQHYVPALIAVLTSALTLFSMLKIWLFVFWGPSKSVKTYQSSQLNKLAWSSCSLVILSLGMAFGFEYALNIAYKSSQEIFNRDIYIQAVYTSPAFKGNL